MATRTGSVLSSDPRAQAQAASIGATIDKNGWWYKDGKRLDPQTADAMVNAAGSGIGGLSDEGHGAKSRGWLSDTVNRNESWLKPVAVGAASLLGSPALGAAVAGGWNYSKNHDLGKAALDAGMTYGGGKLLSGAGKALGKIPGATAAGNAIKGSGIGQAVSNVGDFAKGITIPGMGGVSDALKGSLAGLAPKGVGGGGLSGIGDFLKDYGLPAASLANAAYLGQKSNNYAELAGANADSRWKAQGPLREKGIAGLLKPVPVNLSDLETQRRSGNPFSTPLSVGG